jgi:photosystem II stability/assembly factor-like uncharacterized protein
MFSFKKILILILFLFCFQTARADWVKQNTKSLAWFHDVYFLSENKGWITGSGGTLLTTADGGKTWKQESNFTKDNIRQVYFTSENDGWLLCERDIYSLGSSAPSYLLKTSDGGANWERIEFGEGDHRREKVAKIFFNKKGAGAAIGERGAYFSLQDDKKTWKKKPSPVRYLMLDGVFTDDFSGAMVGAGGAIFFTEDAGWSWNKSNVPENSNTRLNSVFFINQKTGWAVGTEGKIYQTFNGGKVWREQKSATTKDLTDVFFRDTAEGWAVGEEGLILHTTTAGNVWTIVEAKAKHRLEKIIFVGKQGWAVGFGGTILFYSENAAANDTSAMPPKLKTRN